MSTKNSHLALGATDKVASVPSAAAAMQPKTEPTPQPTAPEEAQSAPETPQVGQLAAADTLTHAVVAETTEDALEMLSLEAPLRPCDITSEEAGDGLLLINHSYGKRSVIVSRKILSELFRG